jgi:hypothetical protein
MHLGARTFPQALGNSSASFLHITRNPDRRIKALRKSLAPPPAV